MAKDENTYWNPILETMPREKLRRLQVKKFKRIFEWAYNNSPFYKKLYKDAGMEPGDIKTYDDIKKVPQQIKECSGTYRTDRHFPMVTCWQFHSSR